MWKLDFNGKGKWDGCKVDKCFGPFGQAGDVPVVGDWNGTGTAKIGVSRAKTGKWCLDVNGNGQWDGCNVDRCLSGFGQGIRRWWVNGKYTVEGIGTASHIIKRPKQIREKMYYGGKDYRIRNQSDPFHRGRHFGLDRGWDGTFICDFHTLCILPENLMMLAFVWSLRHHSTALLRVSGIKVTVVFDLANFADNTQR
jgi:hypothetical protein